MPHHQIINYSYWELKHYFKRFDLIIVGSGIVGLSTAISFKEKNKNAAVLILERGFLPDGASLKNAGFACFGSAGELLDDLEKIPEEIVWKTVAMRYEGLSLLRERVGDDNMDYQANGGYEIFTDNSFDKVSGQLDVLNGKIKDILGVDNCYKVSTKYRFNNCRGLIFNNFEAQIDSGKMMSQLKQIAFTNGVEILKNVTVNVITDNKTSVNLSTDRGVFTGSKVVVCTNGFAKQLLNLNDIVPARAQVLITEPIKNLSIEGTFHFNTGYYYFRNIDNRILFGGGRNLDFAKEETTENELNQDIQNKLDEYLQQMILPGVNYEIEHRWTGIMGVGTEKEPIIREISENVVAAVRMGGMGIAIGSVVGQKAAELVN